MNYSIKLTMIAAISGSVSNKDFSRDYIVVSTVMSSADIFYLRPCEPGRGHMWAG